MSFNQPAQQYNPVYTPVSQPSTPTRADSTVLMAGMSGLRPSKRPELSNVFNTSVGSPGGLGRKPATSKRSLIGGA